VLTLRTDDFGQRVKWEEQRESPLMAVADGTAALLLATWLPWEKP
jgi:hypothetical protein